MVRQFSTFLLDASLEKVLREHFADVPESKLKPLRDNVRQKARRQTPQAIEKFLSDIVRICKNVRQGTITSLTKMPLRILLLTKNKEAGLRLARSTAMLLERKKIIEWPATDIEATAFTRASLSTSFGQLLTKVSEANVPTNEIAFIICVDEFSHGILKTVQGQNTFCRLFGDLSQFKDVALGVPLNLSPLLFLFVSNSNDLRQPLQQVCASGNVKLAVIGSVETRSVPASHVHRECRIHEWPPRLLDFNCPQEVVMEIAETLRRMTPPPLFETTGKAGVFLADKLIPVSLKPHWHCVVLRTHKHFLIPVVYVQFALGPDLFLVLQEPPRKQTLLRSNHSLLESIPKSFGQTKLQHFGASLGDAFLHFYDNVAQNPQTPLLDSLEASLNRHWELEKQFAISFQQERSEPRLELPLPVPSEDAFSAAPCVVTLFPRSCTVAVNLAFECVEKSLLQETLLAQALHTEEPLRTALLAAAQMSEKTRCLPALTEGINENTHRLRPPHVAPCRVGLLTYLEGEPLRPRTQCRSVKVRVGNLCLLFLLLKESLNTS